MKFVILTFVTSNECGEFFKFLLPLTMKHTSTTLTQQWCQLLLFTSSLRLGRLLWRNVEHIENVKLPLVLLYWKWATSKCPPRMTGKTCLQMNQSLTFTLEQWGQPHDLQQTIHPTAKQWWEYSGIGMFCPYMHAVYFHTFPTWGRVWTGSGSIIGEICTTNFPAQNLLIFQGKCFYTCVLHIYNLNIFPLQS